MVNRDRVVEIGVKVLEGGHRALLALTGGRFPHRMLGMEAVELHTIGRKSGQRRSAMLTAPIFEPDRVVLVASKGGHTRHPDWYLNLVAHRDVELTIRGETRPFVARTATAEEKAELWPAIVATYRGYASYQKATDRDIPVVICEPR